MLCSVETGSEIDFFVEVLDETNLMTFIRRLQKYLFVTLTQENNQRIRNPYIVCNAKRNSVNESSTIKEYTLQINTGYLLWVAKQIFQINWPVGYLQLYKARRS